MAKGDAELAAVMRKLLKDKRNSAIFWGADSVLEVDAFVELTEDEAEAVKEVLHGE